MLNKLYVITVITSPFNTIYVNSTKKIIVFHYDYVCHISVAQFKEYSMPVNLSMHSLLKLNFAPLVQFPVIKIATVQLLDFEVGTSDVVVYTELHCYSL